MRVLASELTKIRRTWLAPLAALGPLGVIVLTVVMWLIQGEWLHEAIATRGAWVTTMNDVGMLEVAAIALGTAVLASLIFDVDHRSNGWKQLFARPVSRAGIYLSKLAYVAALLLGSSAIVVVGVIGVWRWQGLGALPWDRLGWLFILVWIAVMPLIALQGALSAHIRNQAVAIIAGVTGTVLSLFGRDDLPDWLPWSAPGRVMRWIVQGEGDPGKILAIGCAVTIVVAIASALVFARRDVV